jgi:hypothetical protein
VKGAPKSIIAMLGLVVVMATGATVVAITSDPPVASSDTAGPEGVRVQTFQQNGATCIVATHDTAQGASVGLWCR